MTEPLNESLPVAVGAWSTGRTGGSLKPRPASYSPRPCVGIRFGILAPDRNQTLVLLLMGPGPCLVLQPFSVQLPSRLDNGAGPRFTETKTETEKIVGRMVQPL